MRFEFTPDEAQPAAIAIVKYFRKRHHVQMQVEKKVWDEAPCRTTLCGVQSGLQIIIETQGTLNYGGTLKALATWLAARRHYAQFYIAIPSDATLQANALEDMRKDGVGLLLVADDGTVQETQRARNPALVVTPEPALRLGPCKREVEAALKKFNETDRRDGLRDMCDVVERLTREVGVAASRKGWLKTPEAQFTAKDWSGQINELARPEVYHGGRTPLVSANLKDDLHSFRGSRNLVGHPARGRRDEKRRQRQFAERMMQGPRLMAELVTIKRRIR